MSQNTDILTYLKSGRSITHLEAMKLEILRLAARIKNLRNEGYNIVTTIIKRNGKRFASYRLNQ